MLDQGDNNMGGPTKSLEEELMQLTLQIRNKKSQDEKYASFRGDKLIGDVTTPEVGVWSDLQAVLAFKNWPVLKKLIDRALLRKGPDGESLAQIAGSLSNYSTLRQKFIDKQVKSKYDAMLHPPLTYLGDCFQYRTADGKFNSALNPHLGQAGAPYAKTVPSKAAPLGALPDPSDIFDRLMSRDCTRQSKSGLSSMLIYHATIIIHDIFRTNADDKNISDSSSYLDLSPLYGYTMELQRKVRDDKYKLGLLKPDTFAEDRLLRQPPGVCIMLVMYNRYHNYAAAQLRRINENNRFSVPRKYKGTCLEAMVRNFAPQYGLTAQTDHHCEAYSKAWYAYKEAEPSEGADEDVKNKFEATFGAALKAAAQPLEQSLQTWHISEANRKAFTDLYNAAWSKLDDDLFNTARLITCGMYIQISVHDYLRALMGFHQFDTNFTLDPRSDFDQKKTTRGLGNQVTVEFNLLYRFHCAISQKDEAYTEAYMKKKGIKNPSSVTLAEFFHVLGANSDKREPCDATFGLPEDEKLDDKKLDNKKSDDAKFVFKRNKFTNLFDDQQMINALTEAMDEPISEFGPRNVPKCLKPVEIMGILQARKWGIGTLNDFREFFDMSRHETFQSISKNVDIQNALRDLYEHPDKVELYPGIFCESNEHFGLDPGPAEASSALWTAIFSDAITLVRSDRFYTVDWNTNSLTSWGMKEVTPNNSICKSSVFHRLLQRAFPGWYPYNSVRFFHPFYTAQQNAAYAKAQGYEDEFKMSKKSNHTNQKTGEREFNVTDSDPMKPEKPMYLKDAEKIKAVLEDNTGSFIHPALADHANLPGKIGEVFQRNEKIPPYNPLRDGNILEGIGDTLQYLNDLTRAIVRRESIAVSKGSFQVDAVKDFAIPIVTRYVADFLGFGHLLITEENAKGTYSENEIYQLITNCQVFLTYNSDETKLLKRRKAFKESLALLFQLTLHGNIAQANQWAITRALMGGKKTNPMIELGFKTASQILEHESDPEKAAAILLFIGLDFAYNSVLAFTAVLSELLGELYKVANNTEVASDQTPRWLTIQKLAFSNEYDYITLTEMVRQVACTTVRLPIVRKVLEDRKFTTSTGEKWSLQKDQIVFLDIWQANKEAIKANEQIPFRSLAVHSSMPAHFRVYHPHHLSDHGVASMIRLVAQMRNPRRGHDTQGFVKKVRLDYTPEGYANFMAPMRISRLAAQVRANPDDPDAGVYSGSVLRPGTDTYMTPTWDEMVPFPTTWKIRFEGFGVSDYSSSDGKPFGKLVVPTLPDDAPPFYQPQGLSHFGGSFADCLCATGDCRCSEKKDGQGKKDGSGKSTPLTDVAAQMPTLSTGCGLSS
ncbi:heme peroxidase [Xylariaceae sp. AK1471]|nr:heme peroxidase [Xylariaceae sp. AK1471]